MNQDMIAGRIAREVILSWKVDPAMYIQEGKRVRRVLMDAARELQGLMRISRGTDMESVTGEAMESLELAMKMVDKMLGVGMSVDVDRQLGFTN